MNKIFKIVFNAARGKMMVVNEATSSVQTGKKAAVTVAVIGALAAGSAVAAEYTYYDGYNGFFVEDTVLTENTTVNGISRGQWGFVNDASVSGNVDLTMNSTGTSWCDPVLGEGGSRINVNKLVLNATASKVIYSSFDTAKLHHITASDITISSKKEDAIYTEAAGVIIDGFETLNIMGGSVGYAIVNNSDEGNDISIVGTGTVNIESYDRTAIYHTADATGKTSVEAKDIVITGFKEGYDSKKTAINILNGGLSLKGSQSVKIVDGKKDGTTAINLERGKVHIESASTKIDGITRIKDNPEGYVEVGALNAAGALTFDNTSKKVKISGDDVTVTGVNKDGKWGAGIHTFNDHAEINLNSLTVNNETGMGLSLENSNATINVANIDISAKGQGLFANSQGAKAGAKVTINGVKNLKIETAEDIGVRTADNQFLEINAAEGGANIEIVAGKVYGLMAGSGDNSIVINNAEGTNTISLLEGKYAVDSYSALTIVGKKNILNGGIQTGGNNKEAAFIGETTVNGDISAKVGDLKVEGTMIFNGDKAEIGNLTGNKATFTITDANQVVSITNANEALTVAATGAVNDEAGLDALQGVVTGDTNGVQLVAYEGMNSKGTTATLDKDGNLTNVVETTNSIMSNTLDLASAAPLAMNRLLMNDVRKRMGDLRAAEGTHGVWARYDGGKLSGERGLENDFTTVQVGIDTVPVADAPRFGVAFAYTKSDADMMRGSADMDAFSLAFYGTKFYDNGMFVDVIGRMATADTDVTVDANKKGSMDNIALSLSGELGWRFDVTEKFYFEPQAELTYTYVNADKLDLSGTTYEFDSVDSLMARVGFAAGFKCPSNYGDVYVRASAVHEFLGDTAVMSGKNIHEVDGEDTWVEFGIGAQFNVNKNTYVYADIERTEGAKLEEDWRANVGVRYAF